MHEFLKVWWYLYTWDHCFLTARLKSKRLCRGRLTCELLVVVRFGWMALSSRVMSWHLTPDTGRPRRRHSALSWFTLRRCCRTTHPVLLLSVFACRRAADVDWMFILNDLCTSVVHAPAFGSDHPPCARSVHKPLLADSPTPLVSSGRHLAVVFVVVFASDVITGNMWPLHIVTSLTGWWFETVQSTNDDNDDDDDDDVKDTLACASTLLLVVFVAFVVVECCSRCTAPGGPLYSWNLMILLFDGTAPLPATVVVVVVVAAGLVGVVVARQPLLLMTHFDAILVLSSAAD